MFRPKVWEEYRISVGDILDVPLAGEAYILIVVESAHDWAMYSRSILRCHHGNNTVALKLSGLHHNVSFELFDGCGLDGACWRLCHNKSPVIIPSLVVPESAEVVLLDFIPHNWPILQTRFIVLLPAIHIVDGDNEVDMQTTESSLIK